MKYILLLFCITSVSAENSRYASRLQSLIDHEFIFKLDKDGVYYSSERQDYCPQLLGITTPGKYDKPLLIDEWINFKVVGLNEENILFNPPDNQFSFNRDPAIQQTQRVMNNRPTPPRGLYKNKGDSFIYSFSYGPGKVVEYTFNLGRKKDLSMSYLNLNKCRNSKGPYHRIVDQCICRYKYSKAEMAVLNRNVRIQENREKVIKDCPVFCRNTKARDPERYYDQKK